MLVRPGNMYLQEGSGTEAEVVVVAASADAF